MSAEIVNSSNQIIIIEELSLQNDRKIINTDKFTSFWTEFHKVSSA